MALIAQDTARLSSVLKYEFEPNTGFCREVLVVAAAEGTVIKPGTVIGQHNGAYRIVEANDTVVGVSINEGDVVVPASGSVKLVVIETGPAIFAKQALVVGATVDTVAEKDAVYAGLKAKHIKVSDQI